MTVLRRLLTAIIKRTRAYQALERDRDNLKRLSGDRYVRIIELTEDLEVARALANPNAPRHADGCVHTHEMTFRCDGCGQVCGACLGCADEHYSLCDGCAGQEVTR